MLPVRNPSGILGPKNNANYGNSIIVPAVPTNAAPGNFIFTTDQAAVPGPNNNATGGTGDIVIIPSISQVEPASPENLVLALSAIPISGSPNGTLRNVSLYAVLSWETAKSLFGFTSDKVAAGIGVGNFFFPEILVDIGFGTSLTIPGASTFRAKIRYTARTNQAGGFSNPTNLPQFRINAALSYGQTTRRPTYTQFVDNSQNNPAAPFTLPHGGTGPIVMRPPFAESLMVTWIDSRTAGPVDLNFMSVSGQSVWTTERIAANTTPPPVIPWPNEAWAVQVINSDAANDISFARIVNILNL